MAIVEELLFAHLKLKRFSTYVQDYGAPVGFRIASENPGAIEAIIVQNGNAYIQGVSPAFEPLRASFALLDRLLDLADRRFRLVGFRHTSLHDAQSACPCPSRALRNPRLFVPSWL